MSNLSIKFTVSSVLETSLLKFLWFNNEICQSYIDLDKKSFHTLKLNLEAEFKTITLCGSFPLTRINRSNTIFAFDLPVD